jgi:hypothetical protein
MTFRTVSRRLTAVALACAAAATMSAGAAQSASAAPGPEEGFGVQPSCSFFDCLDQGKLDCAFLGTGDCKEPAEYQPEPEVIDLSGKVVAVTPKPPPPPPQVVPTANDWRELEWAVDEAAGEIRGRPKPPTGCPEGQAAACLAAINAKLSGADAPPAVPAKPAKLAPETASATAEAVAPAATTPWVDPCDAGPCEDTTCDQNGCTDTCDVDNCVHNADADVVDNAAEGGMDVIDDGGGMADAGQ